MEGEVVVSAMDKLIAGVPSFFQLMTSCFNFALDNPLLSVGIVAMVIGIVFGVLGRARGSIA